MGEVSTKKEERASQKQQRRRQGRNLRVFSRKLSAENVRKVKSSTLPMEVIEVIIWTGDGSCPEEKKESGYSKTY